MRVEKAAMETSSALKKQMNNVHRNFATLRTGLAPPPETQTITGAWMPKEAKGHLPDVKHIKPTSIQLPHHPLWRKGPQTLMRAIDLESRFRHDNSVLGGNNVQVKRSAMFWGPNSTAVPGCVLLIDQITSRVSPQQKYFAGVLMGVRKKGIMSNMVLRSVVMDVGVEMTFPIFSPMISNITVLKEIPSDIPNHKRTAVYWARDKYCKTSIDFKEIEGMVMKHKNQLFRAKQVLAEKAAKVKGSAQDSKKK